MPESAEQHPEVDCLYGATLLLPLLALNLTQDSASGQDNDTNHTVSHCQATWPDWRQRNSNEPQDAEPPKSNIQGLISCPYWSRWAELL